LPGSGNPGDTAEHAERNLDVDLFQVVLRGALDREGADRLRQTTVSPAPGWKVSPARYCRVRAVGMRLERSARPRPLLWKGTGSGEDELAAALAAAWADVDEVVGGADDGFLVLDDDEGVAEIAEPLHHADELADVTRDAGRRWVRRGRKGCW
jgi:hypothetical protein